MTRGPNPYCTTFQVLEQLAQAHSTAELLSALRHPRLPRSVREVLRFGHSGDDIDLPRHALAIEPISTRAYVEDNDAPFDPSRSGLFYIADILLGAVSSYCPSCQEEAEHVKAPRLR